MRRIGITLLAAVFGGAIAIGGYKLFESKQFDNMTFDEQQKVFYAKNASGEMISSTGNPDFTQAAAAVTPGVVHIKVSTTPRGGQGGQGGGSPFDMFEEFFGVPRQRRGPAQPRQAQASGSGVIISPDGYIVTNNHVVEDADKIEVKLTDNRTYEAKVIGRDPNFDLALIKVNATNLPIVKLGNSDDVQVGEWVLAVGYPLGLQSTVTAGIVSAKGRRIGILDEQPSQQRGFGGQQEQMVSTAIESFIQTDAVINRGNSGGALVNAHGELIGINSAIASPTGTYAGYGFAIPISLAKKVLDDFKEFGSVKRGYVGISFKEVDAVRKEYGLDDVNGLYVEEVVKGGGAAAAGIKKGDVVTKVNGKVIYGSPDLQERVARLRPGDKIKLTYKREGKEKEVDVTLKAEESINPSTDKEEPSASATEIFNKLGASFMPANDARKKELGISSGVVVSQVHRGGLFEYFNIQRGLVITEVNGKAVNNVDEIESALGHTSRNMVRIKGVRERGNTIEMNIPIKY